MTSLKLFHRLYLKTRGRILSIVSIGPSTDHNLLYSSSAPMSRTNRDAFLRTAFL